MDFPIFSRRSFLRTASAASVILTSLKTSNTIAAEPIGLQNHICVTCGTQYPKASTAPEKCPICEDERQYIGANGQEWTSLAKMTGQYRNAIRQHEDGLWGIGTEPKFAIGQRALLIQTKQGNILWDCISFLDEETIASVKKLGGISAIAISHPHYYSSMIEWSRAFGDVPIHLHEADRQWVQRPDKAVQFWSGEQKEIGDGLTLVRTAGHFEGYQVLHWRDGTQGKGTLFSGDQPFVAADRRWVSFMYSYPNFIPLNPPAIRRIGSALEPFTYDRIYGAWWHSIVDRDGKVVVQRSAERYLRAIGA